MEGMMFENKVTEKVKMEYMMFKNKIDQMKIEIQLEILNFKANIHRPWKMFMLNATLLHWNILTLKNMNKEWL